MNAIYDTLLTECEIAAGGYLFKVPNAVFTPPDNGEWIDFIIIPNGPAKLGLTDLAADQGILRALVYWSPGVGTEAPGEVCKMLADHFYQGARFFSDPPGTVVEIYRPAEIGAAQEDGQSVYFPVSIRYRAFS